MRAFRLTFAVSVALLALALGPTIHAQEPPPPPPSPPPPDYITYDCRLGERATRGWLDGNFISGGVHPQGRFGPAQLHGPHYMIPTESPLVNLVLRDEYAVATTSYYPGSTYNVEIFCTPRPCAFQFTVETVANRAQSGVDYQLGGYDGSLVASDPKVTMFNGGLYDYKALVSTSELSNAYNFTWTAPEELTYATYYARVTYVVEPSEVEYVCDGLFVEQALTSSVVCGDAVRDPLEGCDDGNTEAGDGCGGNCEVELGWTCDEFVDGPVSGSTTSVCTAAAVSVTPVAASKDAATGGVVMMEGETAEFEVELSTYVQEGKSVFITLMPVLTGTTDTIASYPSSLNFLNLTAFAHDKPQRITLTASSNDRVDGTRSYELGFVVTASDPNFVNVTIGSLPIKVLDNDVPGLVVSKRDLYVTESGVTDLYFVHLTSEPTGTLIVDIESFPANQILPLPMLLSFGPANWQLDQMIEVQALDNQLVDAEVLATIHHAIDADKTFATEYVSLNTSSVDVSVVVMDNDSPAVQVYPRNDLIVTEGHYTEYSVVLLTKPESTVYLNITTSSEDVRVVSSDTNSTYLALTKFDYNAASQHVVRVYGINNFFVDGTRDFEITHVLNSDDALYAALSDSTAAPWTVYGSVVDDDTPQIIYEKRLELTEGGGEVSLAFRLGSAPYADVKVKLGLVDNSYLYIGGDVMRDETLPYIFWPAAEFDAVKVLTFVVTSEDQVDSGLRNTQLNLVLDSEDVQYDALALAPIKITTLENDASGVTISPNYDLEVTEGGDPLVLAVRLNTRPQLDSQFKSTIVKLIYSTDANQLVMDPPAHYFDRSNFSVSVPLTLRAVDDTHVEAVQHATLVKVTVESADSQYSGVVVPDLRVSINENDFVSTEVEIGQWGGVVAHTVPYGAALVTIPPGTIPPGVTQKVVLEEAEAPLPAGTAGPLEIVSGREVHRVSGLYGFRPHGLAFNNNIQISLQYDEAAAETSGGFLGMFRSDDSPDGPFTVVPDVFFNQGVATVSTTHFSFYYVGAGPPPPGTPPPSPPPAIDVCEGCCDYSDEDVQLATIMVSMFCAENLVLVLAGVAYFIYRRLHPLPPPGEQVHAVDPLALPAPERPEPVALPGPYVGLLPGLAGDDDPKAALKLKDAA